MRRILTTKPVYAKHSYKKAPCIEMQRALERQAGFVLL